MGHWSDHYPGSWAATHRRRHLEYQARSAANRAARHYNNLEQANKRIAELEAEVASLTAQHKDQPHDR